jgi:translation initiation factor IF-2
MNRPADVQADLYEKVLDHARREIDEASGKIEEIQRTLRLLEARVEAAKSVYEAVAARLNLEDELEEESESPAFVPAPPPEQAPEPPEESEAPAERAPETAPAPAPVAESVAEPAAQAQPEPPPFEAPPEIPEVPAEPAEADKSGNGSGGFSMDLIRRHFEQKAEAQAATEDEKPAKAEPAGGSAFPELSEAERKLIEEHMRSRAEAERKG